MANWSRHVHAHICSWCRWSLSEMEVNCLVCNVRAGMEADVVEISQCNDIYVITIRCGCFAAFAGVNSKKAAGSCRKKYFLFC